MPFCAFCAFFQMALEEGKVLRRNLQGALSQTDFLNSSLGQELMKSLERAGTDALTDSATQLSDLLQSLQVSRQPGCVAPIRMV